MINLPSPAALLVLSLGLPRELAIYLVPPLMLVLLFQGKENIMREGELKLVLLMLLVIPIYLSVSGRTVEVARFAGLGMLIAIFPFQGIRLNFLREACLILFGYVLTFQIGIMIGNGPMTGFRETFYPIADNRWEEATVEQIYDGFRNVRAAGLFYNPNVMAQLIFFPYLISSLWFKKPFSGPVHTFLAVGSIVSIALTGSRTYLASLVIILLLNAVRSQVIRVITTGGLIVIGLEFIREFVLSDFSTIGGSMGIKFSILSDYIATMSQSPEGWASLVAGGTYDVHFDADIGYILGAWGFVGLAVTASVTVFCCMRLEGSWRVIVPVYLTSFANSLFFSLLNAPFLVVVVLTLAARAEYQKLPVPAKRDRSPPAANRVGPRALRRPNVPALGVRPSADQA